MIVAGVFMVEARVEVEEAEVVRCKVYGIACCDRKGSRVFEKYDGASPEPETGFNRTCRFCRCSIGGAGHSDRSMSSNAMLVLDS